MSSFFHLLDDCPINARFLDPAKDPRPPSEPRGMQEKTQHHQTCKYFNYYLSVLITRDQMRAMSIGVSIAPDTFTCMVLELAEIAGIHTAVCISYPLWMVVLK